MPKASSAGSPSQMLSHLEEVLARGPMSVGPRQLPATPLPKTLVTLFPGGYSKDPGFYLVGADPLGDLALSEVMCW